MKFVDDYETYLAENMINVVVEGGNASLQKNVMLVLIVMLWLIKICVYFVESQLPSPPTHIVDNCKLLIVNCD